jgi:hypothetical protein
LYASSTLRGASASFQESATNRCSPSLIIVRPTARVPSKPMFMSLVSISSTSDPSLMHRPWR